MTQSSILPGRLLTAMATPFDETNGSLDLDQAKRLANALLDSGTEGLQNLVTGQQSMTIFKNVKLEANAAAQLAIALIAGKNPSAAGMTLTKFDDPQSPSHNLQALLLPPQVITQANINDVIKAGALTQAQICQGITSDCAKIGLQ